ncbi:MAG: glycosyltransferase family 39 protein [Deltaproteobacteria bacterium]|nr:glycosyltransferase family 39 protein [Deltaproteobacteria bacterium]
MFRDRIVPRLEAVALAGLGVLAAYVVGRYFWVAWETLAYPYHLEWMEGGVLETAVRLREGLSIYPEPSIDYVGYLYTPLYFAATAVSTVFFGETLFAARIVSFVAVLATAALLYRFARREGVPVRWAVFAAVLLFASYDFSGRWLHLARVDSLFVLLLFASLYALRFWESQRGAVACAAIMWLAFLTKQSAVIALFPVGLAVLVADRRRGLIIGGVFAALVAVSVLILWQMTDGWFWYYAVEVPGGHALMPDYWVGFWQWDVWRVAAVVGVILPGLGLLIGEGGFRALFYPAMFIGALAVSYSSRLHSGGAENVVMPTFTAAALLAPIALHLLEDKIGAGERERLGTSPVAISLMVLVAFQLVASLYSLREVIPGPEEHARGGRLMDYLEAVDGEVLLPDHRFLQRAAGKKSYGLGMAARDVLRVPPGPDRGRDALEASIGEAFASRRFQQVILSDGGFLGEFLRPYYCYRRPFPYGPTPVTGWRLEPQWLWVPRTPETVMGRGDQAHECLEAYQRGP